MIEKNLPEDEPDAEASPGAAPRTQEEVARALGASPAPGGGVAGAESALREDGPLRLDKSGALAGRPKLAPVRALRPDDAAPDAGGPAPPSRTQGKPSGGGARRASLPSRLSSLRPAAFETPAAADAAQADAAAHAGTEVRQIEIPAGTFLYGENRRERELPAFSIDKYPVTNAAYAAFVAATGHRPAAYWSGGTHAPELAAHPVVGVDYFDALAYARWVGKDLPFEDEWERAARGTDGRVYPWGNDQDLSGANTARVGLKMTVPVDLHAANASPDGVRDMVGNAWEITHSPAPGGGVVVRGGSWYDFALYAKTYFRFASKPDAGNGTIGFRCCVRESERDAPREVPRERVDAAIEERRGPRERVEPREWSIERRDLVVDLPRLRTHVAEVHAEDLIAPKRGVAVALHGPPERVEAPIEERIVVPSKVPSKVPIPEPAADAPEEAGPAEPDERVHVGGPPAPPTLRPPVLQSEPAVEEPAAKRAERVAAAPARSRSMPPHLWILLTAGLLLFGGLLATLVNQDDQKPPPLGPDPIGPSPAAVRAPVTAEADLPEPPPFDDFPGAGRLARIFDITEVDDAAALRDGTWLLLFADTESPEGQQTLQAAHGLHRRLAPRGVRVAVVVPRDPYQDADGGLGAHEPLASRLKADSRNWLWDGIAVLLDPLGEDRIRTSLHVKYCRADDHVAAVLLHDGVRESRAAPPAGGFRLASLVRIGLLALKLATG